MTEGSVETCLSNLKFCHPLYYSTLRLQGFVRLPFGWRDTFLWLSYSATYTIFSSTRLNGGCFLLILSIHIIADFRWWRWSWTLGCEGEEKDPSELNQSQA